MNHLDTILTPHPGAIPWSPIIWPGERHVRNQIQQTKGSAKPQEAFALPSTQPNRSIVAPRTTPQHVSHIRVVSKRLLSGQKVITVQFNHPSNDPYFAGASVYLRRAGQQPTLVASGSKSPLTFSAAAHQAPHVIHVSSFGNW